ncbi:MAG: hypothetical protein GY924_13555 [Planctomycetaceae bacterium]|nr:hypothetical protein [Planctomycetaceae bacterium]
MNNHANELVSIDFFTVPTATFRILYVLLVLDHERRQVLHFNITAHPTATWTAQQMVEAFPFDTAPKYLLRDRDKIYGAKFCSRVQGLGIAELHHCVSIRQLESTSSGKSAPAVVCKR